MQVFAPARMESEPELKEELNCCSDSHSDWELVSTSLPESPRALSHYSQNQYEGDHIDEDSAVEGSSDAGLTDTLIACCEPGLTLPDTYEQDLTMIEVADPVHLRVYDTLAFHMDNLYRFFKSRITHIMEVVDTWAAQAQPFLKRVVASVWQRVGRFMATIRPYISFHLPIAKYTLTPTGLSSLVSSTDWVDEASKLSAQMKYAAVTTKKRLGTVEIDWVRIALAIGCAALAGALARTTSANALLTERLAQRERELADLLGKVMQLQRSIYAQRPVPIVRHTSSCSSHNWPAVIHTL